VVISFLALMRHLAPNHSIPAYRFAVEHKLD